jgi:hypothetical protein
MAVRRIAEKRKVGPFGSGPLWTGACLAAKRARVQSGEGVIDAAPIPIGGDDG